MKNELLNSNIGGFVVREAANVAELVALLKLRYRVYRESQLKSFVEPNEHGLDIDCYDIRSNHYGLFKINNGIETAIGYLRVIHNNSVPSLVNPLEIIQLHPMLADKLVETPSYPFPLMEYVPNVKRLADRCHEIYSHNQLLCEASRFSLDSEHRSLRLARLIVESALAIYLIHYKFDYAMWCCDATKSAFYRLYGLEQFEGIEISDYTGIGVESACLFGSPGQLPEKIISHLNLMAEEFAQTRSISYKSPAKSATPLILEKQVLTINQARL